MYYLTTNEWLHKIFWNGGKNITLLIKNSEVWEKYEEIWNVIKNKLNIKFHSQPIYENKYLKAKVKEFDGNIKTSFFGNNLPKRKYLLYMHCLRNYWFCFKNEQKKLSTSLFKRM